MSLDLLRVALQGLAPLPFPLSPLAMAVQGLLEELQEERRDDVRGSGRRRPGPARRVEPARRRRDEGLTEDLVRQQWELLEIRRAAPRQAAEAPPAAPSVAPASLDPPKAGENAGAVGQLAAADPPGFPPPAQAAPTTRADDALALLLLLAEA